MRFRPVVVVAVVSAVMVLGAPGHVNATPLDSPPAATSSTPLPPSTPPADCSKPPATADATAANRDRFIALWSPRIADKAWMQHFIDLAAVPADIVAEGFHAMDADTQAWLVACLVDNAVATTGQSLTADAIAKDQAGLNLIIFGKQKLADIRKQLSAPAPSKPLPKAPESAADQALKTMANNLATKPSLTSADLPKADVSTPTTSTSKNFAAQTSPRLQSLAASPAPTPTTAKPATTAAPTTTTTGLDPNSLLNKLGLNVPLVPALLQAVANLAQVVANIQQTLFTIPGVNILAAAFYRVCAESATQPLACSVYLPVGVPNAVDVTGDNFPDVLVSLTPTTNLVDVGANLQINRLFTAPRPLPAHVFVVYDTPLVKKRIEVGFDGRASTLADTHSAKFVLKNAVNALTGDIDAQATVSAGYPGSTESLTFAVKSLVGGSTGVPPTEADPLTGAVQMSPFPTNVVVGAHLIHTASKDEDIFNVQSSTPTVVNALVDQSTTTTSPKSNHRFTALVDKLPTSVNVDLVHAGPKQTIDYTASAAIDHVMATDTATPDTTQPTSYTQSIYDVQGVPTNVHVELQGAQDILYTASAKIPQVTFSTKTLALGVLQQQITAQAHQIPTSVHVTNTTTPDQTAVTYNANAVLQDVSFSMYDLNQDKTNLIATALAIPTQMQFTQTKSTGVYDFSSTGGIGQINASLTRANGSIIPLSGDHATVYKRGTALGLDLQLSGFTSAHFDGSQNTTVSLGLTPGGQEFNAIADMDSPNVLATAHIQALPSTMSVTLSPSAGSATYTASSIIPELDASFTLRDTNTFATATLTGLPKNIGLTFNTTGGSPQITYAADSRLGSIEATYQEAPGAMALHAKISDLPQYMKISGKDPISFDARNAASDPVGTSYLGQILFQYATDGVFQSPPTTDDHVYLDTVTGTHAEVQYTGLQYLSVDTTNQELHTELRNANPRLIRAYLTTPDLTLTGFIDKVPASVKIDQVGNDVKYTASSPISEIYTNLHRTVGDVLTVDVTNIPASVDVVFDAANSKLNWTSSSTAGGISAIAHLTAATLGMTRDFDAALAITAIPTSWFATFGSGNVLFQAVSPGIGAISAQVTNHGSFNTLPGDHIVANYDQPSGDLDASLHISNLTKAGFTKLTDASGGGFVADLNMGNQGSFGIAANINLGTSVLTASGSFDHLPSTMNLKSDGGRITYTGNTNPTLTLSVAAGSAAAIAATPTPPTIHGVAVRDGQSGGDKAVKANLYLTGLPTGLDLNSPAGTYTVTGYHPSIATLALDVVLTTLAPQPLSLELTQVVPTVNPVDFTFGPFLSSTAGDGSHTLSLNYTANQDLGAFSAEVTYGNSDDARLDISSIPHSISVNAAFGDPTKSVGVTMSSGISDITASYKHVGDANLAASVHLHDVPSSVSLNLGRAASTATDGNVATPDFTFTASAPGLDIDAMATADIVSPADVSAAASLMITNLGTTVTGQLDGTTLKITSTPKTDSFLLKASAVINFNVDLGFSVGPFDNSGSLGVNIVVHSLTLGFDDMGTLQLDLGITTGLKGDYSSFTFGEESDTTITLQDTLNFSIGTPFGDASFNIFDVPTTVVPLHNVIDHFRLASNRLDTVLSIDVIDVGLGYCSFDIQARPFPEYSTGGSSFTVGQPPSDSNPPAWLITPDPNLLGFTIPDFVVDIIAYFESPYGHDLTGGLGCHSRI